MDILSMRSVVKRYFRSLFKDNDAIWYTYDIFWYLVNTHCYQLCSHYTSHETV